MNRVGWFAVGAITVLILGIMLLSNNSSSDKESTSKASSWNESMTQGKADAPNSFIEYTDITCPHCAVFHNAIADSSFSKDYIESGKVQFEIRVTSFLQEKSVNSERAGESAYCAADQGKFYEYYDGIVKKMTKDYFDNGIGTSPTAPRIPKLDDSYYLDVAKERELDVDAMKQCLDTNKMLATLNTATRKTAQILPYGSGVPYFVINDTFKSSGFDGDYQTVQQMLRAGGVE